MGAAPLPAQPNRAAWDLPWPVLVPWLGWRLVGVRWALWLLVAAWFVWPHAKDPYSMGLAHDAAYFAHHIDTAWRSWTQYGELPSWNPWFCGGIPQLGNLQDSALSPSMLLLWIFGLGPGQVLVTIAYFALGMEGAWLYARHWDATRIASFAAAAVFALSGRFAMLFVDGQPAFVGFQLAPWVLLGFELGMVAPWAAVGGGLAMALVFLEGGAVATPLLAVLLAWLLLVHVVGRLLWWPGLGWRWRTAWHPLRSLGIMAAVAMAVSAPRLFTVAESILRYPREWQSAVAYSGPELLKMLFDPAPEGGYDGAGTSYVGILVVAMAAWGVLRRPGKGVPLLLFGALTFALAMGHQGKFAPWTLTTKLPVLTNLRCPFRMTFFSALFLGSLGAVGIGALERDVRDGLVWALQRVRRLQDVHRKAMARSAAALLAVVGTWHVAQQPARFNRARVVAEGRKPMPRPATQEFKQAIGNRWEAHIWPALGRGSIACFEEQPFPTTPALRGDLAQEEYLADPTTGTVKRTNWSPHRIGLQVALVKPGQLKVNQNWHRGWSSDVGEVCSDQGLLAVKLPVGTYAVHLRHKDPLVWLGVWISLTSLAGLALFAVYQLWRREQQGVKA